MPDGRGIGTAAVGARGVQSVADLRVALVPRSTGISAALSHLPEGWRRTTHNHVVAAISGFDLRNNSRPLLLYVGFLHCSTFLVSWVHSPNLDEKKIDFGLRVDFVCTD